MTHEEKEKYEKNIEEMRNEMGKKQKRIEELEKENQELRESMEEIGEKLQEQYIEAIQKLKVLGTLEITRSVALIINQTKELFVLENGEIVDENYEYFSKESLNFKEFQEYKKIMEEE